MAIVGLGPRPLQGASVRLSVGKSRYARRYTRASAARPQMYRSRRATRPTEEGTGRVERLIRRGAVGSAAIRGRESRSGCLREKMCCPKASKRIGVRWNVDVAKPGRVQVTNSNLND